MGRIWGLAVLALWAAGTVVAHEGHRPEGAPPPDLAAPVGAPEAPLPVALGGPFALTDQFGDARSEADPDGRAQLLFFGYANCQQICSAALPTMADAADALEVAGFPVRPVMITVDPDRDTVAALGPALAKISPEFIGLTGDPAALAQAYKAFGVEHKKLFEDPEYGAVYAHGSFIYLLDGQGRFLTLLPPVLPADRIADIVKSYLTGRS